MYLEAPMDAWYVWVGVALVSIGLLSVAVALPSEPPPDAERVADAIDRVGASEYEAATTLAHDAEMVRVGPERIAMRNGAGTDRARLSFGPVLPVHALELNDTERRQVDGVLAGERPLPAGLEASIGNVVTRLANTTGGWRPAGDQLRARSVRVDGERVVLVGVR